ncbi:peroxiredoxin [Halothiobacillus sp. DCM-1]|uniref:peroxiredoxin n=1 Tax=Halothiobacillus sp. DCM-1 TaxID=3112558 RepID=UPI003243175B
MRVFSACWLSRGFLPLCAVMLSVGQPAAAAPLEAGQAAPAFTLLNQAGQPVSLSAYRGKWLVLYFYPKDFTSGCTTEAQSFRDAVPSIEAMGVSVVGISEDSVASHAAFEKAYNLNYTLLADENGKVAAAYDSLYDLFGLAKIAKRHTFIIDPQGKIAARFLDVDPAQNPQQVITTLKRLMASR